MLQRMMAMLMALSLLVGSTAIVAAQNSDATPGAAEDNGSDAGSPNLDPMVGDPITFVGDNGDDFAIFTVEDVITGFEDFGEYFDPESDTTYIAVEVTVENVDPDDDAFELSNYYIGLQDDQGYYWQPGYVSLDDDSEYQELEDGDIKPGDSVTGYIFYGIPDDREPVSLFYSPSGRLLQLADVRDA